MLQRDRLSANGREVRVGEIAMGFDGAFGEVERVTGDLVVCRLFPGRDGRGPVTAEYRHSDVTVIREPEDVLTADERAALEPTSAGRASRPSRRFPWSSLVWRAWLGHPTCGT